MDKDILALEILARLKRAYPAAQCALIHEDPFQLLVATILSAQCTDERVNMVTPPLFRRFPDPAAMAQARIETLEEMIRSTGFYRNKSKSILGAAQRLVAVYGGRVPDTMEDLLTLPGVARKTANVVLGTAFGRNEGVVVDTHVHRLSNRMGLTRHQAPEKIEQDLMRLFPREEWTDLSHRLITHGRLICNARLPKCGQCVLGPDACPSYDPAPASWKAAKAKAGVGKKKAAAGGKKTTKPAGKKVVADAGAGLKAAKKTAKKAATKAVRKKSSRKAAAKAGKKTAKKETAAKAGAGAGKKEAKKTVAMKTARRTSR